jgi:hypothetical protein
MEPITAAIVAAVAKLSEPAIKDAYEGFKSLIIRKFGREAKVTKAIADVEAKPESPGRQTVLQEELAEAKAGDDQELLAAARALIDKLQQHGVPAASLHVEAKGERSVAIGGSAIGSPIRTGDETPPPPRS